MAPPVNATCGTGPEQGASRADHGDGAVGTRGESSRRSTAYSSIICALFRPFVDAARQPGVSQPARPQTINHFEKVPGARPLTRTTRHVALTEHGQRILKKSAVPDREVKACVQELKLLRDPVSAAIRIGCLIGTGVQVIPEALRRFEKKCPNMRAELE